MCDLFVLVYFFVCAGPAIWRRSLYSLQVELQPEQKLDYLMSDDSKLRVVVHGIMLAVNIFFIFILRRRTSSGILKFGVSVVYWQSGKCSLYISALSFYVYKLTIINFSFLIYPS